MPCFFLPLCPCLYLQVRVTIADVHLPFEMHCLQGQADAAFGSPVSSLKVRMLSDGGGSGKQASAALAAVAEADAAAGLLAPHFLPTPPTSRKVEVRAHNRLA